MPEITIRRCQVTGVHRNSDSVQVTRTTQHLLEAELSTEDIHELAMIRQEMLDACKGENILSFHLWRRKLMRKKSFIPCES